MNNSIKLGTLAVYKKLWALTQPLSYQKHLQEKFYNELNDNKNFFLVTRFNNLSDEIKISLFGKTEIKSEDITFEWLNNILMPAENKNAVSRFNDAVNGSKNNHLFSYQENDGQYKWQYYSPSTLTTFENKVRADNAKVVLRILTEGSRASIISEEIENFSKPINVLRDNISLSSHNALRIFEKFLWDTTLDENQKVGLINKNQEEVNKRLPDGISWESLEGITVFSTLSGRPGVKMFKTKEENGKLVDDKNDVNLLSKINPQTLPNLMSNVPKVPGYTSDGRLLKNDGKFLNFGAGVD
jgi:hypothetical protein